MSESRIDLTQSLAEGFDFYHLGRVEPASTGVDAVTAAAEAATEFAARLQASPWLFAIPLYGDSTGWLLISFSAGCAELGEHASAELANTLASRLATQLRVMIGPPSTVSVVNAIRTVEGLVARGGQTVPLLYTFLLQDHRIEMRVLLEKDGAAPTSTFEGNWNV